MSGSPLFPVQVGCTAPPLFSVCVSQLVGAAAGEARSPVPLHVLPLNPEMATGARAFVRDLVRQGCMSGPHPGQAETAGGDKWPSS